MLPGGSDHVMPDSVDRTETLPKKQKRMTQRRLEPIPAKYEKRTRKTKLNLFKEKYLNLKKKLSALQIEVGASDDFLLIVKNDIHTSSICHTTKSYRREVYDLWGEDDCRLDLFCRN